jgi:hypothetical protein
MGGKTNKVSTSTVVEIVDHETGEITNTSVTKTFGMEKEPPYIKMYIEDVAKLRDVPHGMSPILLELISQMGYNNIIPAYKPIKLITCRKLNISLDYLNKAIQEFYNKGLFIRVARGVYMADPELFARGKWEDIKTLRLMIDYNTEATKNSQGGRKLKSNLPEEVQFKLGL